MTDEQLMVAYQAGDENAFTEIYNRHIHKMTKFVRDRLHGIFLNDVDDIVQQAFLEFHADRNKFPEDIKVKQRLQAVVWHTLLDYFRFEHAISRDRGVTEQITENEVDPSETVNEAIYNELVAQFEEWLATKPARWKTMLEAGTLSEVAKQADIPATSVWHFRREGLTKIKELCA